MHQAARQFNTAIAMILGYIPLAWSALLLSLVWRAQTILGRLPRASIDDPKLLPFEAHYTLVYDAMLVVIGGSIAMIVLIVLTGRHTPSRARRHALVTFFCGWALIVAMLSLPPINFVTWLLD